LPSIILITWTAVTTKEAETMNQDLSHFAEALVFVHGNKAELEAARHAALCAESGDMETAETWRKVRLVVRAVGPRLAA